MTVEQFNKARYETVRRNTEQQLDALIEPVRARVQQLESQMSADPRDPLTAEYTKAKNMLNAYETIRDNRLREIDKMYGMAYTENQESRATWNEENRTKWREQYGGGEAETADAAVSGGRRAAVQRGSVFDAGNVGNAAQADDEGRKNSPTRTYQQLEGARDEDHGRYRYRFHEVGRENASENSLSIADEWTRGGFTVRVYAGEVESVGANGTNKRGSADAMTLSDGTILLNNNASLPKAEILAHEPIHVYRKRHPEIYRPLVTTLEYSGLNLSNPQAIQTATDLGNTYESTHNGITEVRNLYKFYEELIAQISGHHANNPAFAREKFAPLINDYGGLIAAIENAHRTFAEQNSANQASEESGAFSMPESGERGGKIMEESVGAAVHDPNSYSALQGEYGTIEPGENPTRVVDVPKKTDDTHKVRQFTRTMMEAKSVPDALVNDFENMVKNGEFSYESISNDKTMEHAYLLIFSRNFLPSISRPARKKRL